MFIFHGYILWYLHGYVSISISIDASREDGSFGRLVNDEHRHPNCRMKRTDVKGKPHLCLFALNDIKEGEEISYDYGGEDYPWRTQVCCIKWLIVLQLCLKSGVYQSLNIINHNIKKSSAVIFPNQELCKSCNQMYKFI